MKITDAIKIVDKDNQVFSYKGIKYQIGPTYYGTKIIVSAADTFKDYISKYKKLKGKERYDRIQDDLEDYYIVKYDKYRSLTA